MGKALAGVFLSATFLIFMLFVLSAVSFFLSYLNLTSEQQVIELIFIQTTDNPKNYEVILNTSEEKPKKETLDGDDWEISARVVKLRYYINAFGIKPRYCLERLSSRYESIAQAQTIPPSVVDLNCPPQKYRHSSGIISYMMRKWDALSDAAFEFFIYDTTYGSATYLPMADGAVYRVFLSSTGLLARPANAVAKKSIEHWR